MPKKKSSRSKKKNVAKRVVRRTVRRSVPVALATPTNTVRQRRVVNIVEPAPVVDHVVTETDVVTRPKVEVRRAATLAQALTEPAEVVVKPETKVVRRVVKSDRKRAA
jgi:hypothetical protein